MTLTINTTIVNVVTMKVILFGATGMIGQSVLRECLLDAGVTQVLTVGRTATGATDPKVREVAHKDLYNLAPLAGDLTGYDACFFCVGVTSAGLDEAAYSKVTYDLAIEAARAVLAANPKIAFVFVSGEGADATEKGSTMWARVKGRAENAILAMPFTRAHVVRPGFVRPLHGITSRTALYRVLYVFLLPLVPVIKLLAPRFVITSEGLGRAMLQIARVGADKPVLRMTDLTAIADGLAAR